MAKAKAKEELKPVERKMAKYNVAIEFTEPILAGSPSDPKVYTNFIAARTTPENKEQEVNALPPGETGNSVFPADANGRPHLWDYHVRGYLKEAASAVTGRELSNYKSKIDKFIFVGERKLYFERNGKAIPKAEGECERIVRAMTAQGPRTTPKRSQTVAAGAQLKFSLVVLPLGTHEITEKVLRSWFEYGQYSGMGEWRTGSNGRFKIVEFAKAQ